VFRPRTRSGVAQILREYELNVNTAKYVCYRTKVRTYAAKALH